MSDITWLFVPGDRSDRFAKAASSGADQIICDLEDAVSSDKKDHARREVSAYLSHGGGAAWVRINPFGTPRHAADVKALGGLTGLTGIMVPKAEDPATLSGLSRTFPGLQLIPLIETALGAHNAIQIAQVPKVQRLAFGSVDYALDLGVRESAEILLPVRHALVAASRIAGILPPLDGVTKAVKDEELISSDAEKSRDLGFGGKLCIHPNQLSLVRAAFLPSDQEVDWAKRVLNTSLEGSAAVVDGAMVDKPVIDQARKILDLAAG